jgi:hypothetical protein
MAALYYIIAREIDSDPHVLFRLRGMDLAARFGKAALHRIMPPFTVTAVPAKPKRGTGRGTAGFATGRRSTGPAGETATVSGAASGLSNNSLNLEEIPQCGELIISLLPPDPPFSSRDFALVLAEFYHRCAHDRPWESAGQDVDVKQTEHRFSRSAWSVLCKNPGPGAEPVLVVEDIAGKKTRYSPYEAFEQFVQFSSEDGSESYSFLFYFFKFLNLLCSAGAFIPYVFLEGTILRIIWRPFETLPPVLEILESLAARECGMLSLDGGRAAGRSVTDLLASAFLNEWVRRKFFSLKSGAGFGSSARVFDKESPAESALSGKARLLVTLLEEILAGGEKTLIFSQ